MPSLVTTGCYGKMTSSGLPLPIGGKTAMTVLQANGAQSIMSQFDVLTVGNAIVDIISRCDDQFLIDNGITKSAMNLIDAERA